jgi:anhydro-N-acetylmuramic acid kinase
VKAPLYIGMISGTSRDGVDAALVRFHADTPDILAALCLPYPPRLASELSSRVFAGRRPERNALTELDRQLADHFSEAVDRLLEKAGVSSNEVTAIGSHGQTVWHEPGGPTPVSIQLGDPERRFPPGGYRGWRSGRASGAITAPCSVPADNGHPGGTQPGGHRQYLGHR